MATSFRIERLTSEVAAAYWEIGYGSTIFTHPRILSQLSEEIDWLLIKNGDEPYCLWPVCLNSNGDPQIVDFTYYVGPILMPKMRAIAEHRKFHINKTLYETFIEHAIEKYGGFKVSFPIGLDDVRAFSWWNFHKPDWPKVSIKPRYTAIIDLSESIENITSEFRAVRRREAKKLDSNLAFKRDDSVSEEEIISAYRQAVNNDGRNIAVSIDLKIRKLLKLAKSEFGFISAIRTPNGELLHVSLVLRAKGVSNLVLSASTTVGRKLGVTPVAVLDSIKNSKEIGDKFYDFNGANSPTRADDKHSYGAMHRLFFELVY